MLNVMTPNEVMNLIYEEFSPISESEKVNIEYAVGRVLFSDINAKEYVPDFNRSTVDGYAVIASDTFGCTDSIPAILTLDAEINMGEGADFTLKCGKCAYVPTGGAIPEGADSVVMIEYTESYGDGTIGILKSGAPGANIIFRGDDVYPGKTVLEKGRVITPSDIGALAATGMTEVEVVKKVRVGIISTGDELVEIDKIPKKGQVRDVNSYVLSALFENYGCESIKYGIVTDDKKLIRNKVAQALDECDVVILSGGSSVGIKDAAHEIIESFGKMLLHGISVKPGKPTIMGKCGNKPIIGLPGHPAAAYFISKMFVLPLISRLMDKKDNEISVKAILSEDMGSNHGRSQYNAVKLSDGYAVPIRSKSGLITQLAGADGYICIPGDCEGLKKGTEVDVLI